MGWIGLRHDTPSSTLAWVTGEPISGSVRQMWEITGLHASSLGCVAQSWTKGRHVDVTWPSSKCERALPYLCEQVDWLIDNRTRHAYRMFYGQQSWEEAQQSCRRVGGHLATLTTQNELDFVTGWIARDAWIGLSDNAQEATFTWVDEEPFAFNAFSPGLWSSFTRPWCWCTESTRRRRRRRRATSNWRDDGGRKEHETTRRIGGALRREGPA